MAYHVIDLRAEVWVEWKDEGVSDFNGESYEIDVKARF